MEEHQSESTVNGGGGLGTDATPFTEGVESVSTVHPVFCNDW